ncbi:MAG: hypothetical protein H6559_36090 [Lewinellaceae bacterium]|nr:hypothetical protein [Lewinellaceae bacterium]
MKPKKEGNKYDKIIKVYLGKRKPNIPARLKKEEVFAGFELIDLGRLDYRQMLSSQIPEAVVLAILGDFKGKPPEEAIRSIIARLQQGYAFPLTQGTSRDG